MIMNMFDKKSFKIVVVDDSDFSRAQMTHILSQEGFSVVAEASSAEDAIKAVAEKKPNLVITDIVMPNISGIELADKININFGGVSVIMISSLRHEQIILESISKGVIDFISKPIDPIQLIESVEKCFNLSLKEG
jgi:YesN/AraC family two-component response regulator